MKGAGTERKEKANGSKDKRDLTGEAEGSFFWNWCIGAWAGRKCIFAGLGWAGLGWLGWGVGPKAGAEGVGVVVVDDLEAALGGTAVASDSHSSMIPLSAVLFDRLGSGIRVLRLERTKLVRKFASLFYSKTPLTIALKPLTKSSGQGP